MNVNTVYPPRPAARGLVIALHCSGAGAGQWRKLSDELGPSYELMAPEHYGSDDTGPWPGEHAFTLADEAARTIALIDRTAQKVHLVGHSYGGGVALRVAIERPNRVASLSLYEPSAFHLLKGMSAGGAAPFAEIEAVARTTAVRVSAGDYRGAAMFFVDYWSGPGAWAGLRPCVQSALTRWAPKAPLDFRALFAEPTSADVYRELDFPVLLLRGEHAPAPTRTIAEALPSLLPAAQLAVVAGAGHMGPLTHAETVNALIARHIVQVEAAMLHKHQECLRIHMPPIDRLGACCAKGAVT